VIDTGFNGFLTLPVELIPDLELQFVGTTNAALGDGKQVYFDVYEATVVWDGKERNVVALATDGGALVGTSLLWGYKVTLTMEAGGAVRIEALP
jgi:clan AA aspartic protease